MTLFTLLASRRGPPRFAARRPTPTQAALAWCVANPGGVRDATRRHYAAARDILVERLAEAGVATPPVNATLRDR